MTRSLRLHTAITLSLTMLIPSVGVAQTAASDETAELCRPLPEEFTRKRQIRKFVEEAELPICGIEEDEEVRTALEEAGVELPPLNSEAEVAEDAATDEVAETPDTEVPEIAESEAPGTAVVEEEVLPEIDEEAAAAREAERAARRAERQADREARRAERRAERQAAAALAATDPDAVVPDAEVETEVVTEETSRSSNESFEEAAEESAQARALSGGGGNDTLRNILGAAAAAAVIGSILDNGDEVVETAEDRVIVRRDGEYVVLKEALLHKSGCEGSFPFPGRT